VTRVKICGITNRGDAEDALCFGADAIGFVFAQSPRQISVNDAKKISRAVGPWMTTVGVFVNENERNILRIASECRLSVIQLHGDEPASELHRLKPYKVIKAFRILEKEDLNKTKGYNADAYLFDTKVSDVYGGSGKSFDWALLRSTRVPKPYIVSGGLTPQNVKTVIRILSPYGVDVSSCVEKSPGKKDTKLVKRFIHNAKEK
jgi:phosphoribosylanthranilate isomerase